MGLGAAMVGAVATAETVQVGNLILTVDGGFRPTTLPRNELTPIALWGEGHGRTDDGSVPPIAKEIVGDFDRHGTLTTDGIARCEPRQLQNTTTRQALRKCGDALVGRGEARGIVDFPDQEPFEAAGPLLAFNGTPKAGKPVVVFHVIANVPLPTTFVVPARITDSPLPGMGKRITASVPPIAGYNGRLTDIELRIFRRPRSGERYLLARCANGRFRARLQVTLLAEDLRSDGDVLTVGIVRRCRAPSQ